MKKAVQISVLVLVLACSASAGVMPNGADPTPPPPPISSEASSDGWIGTGLTETIANVLGSVLSLF